MADSADCLQDTGMKILRNRKGAVNIFWALITLLLSAAIMIIATNIFATFAVAPNALVTTLQRSYDAQCGIYSAKRQIDAGSITGSTTFSIDLNNGGGTTDVSVTVTLLAANDFNITSTSDGKTITAHYLKPNMVSLE